jgi:cell division protein ZapA (FtsZ GTPase activity inhibitor)
VFDDKQPTTVEVHGHSFTFTVEDAERLQRAAELVENRIKTLESRSQLPSTVKLAIWTALELAVEWLELSEGRKLLRSTVQELCDRLDDGLQSVAGAAGEADEDPDVQL